jgi:hypothetical protein
MRYVGPDLLDDRRLLLPQPLIAGVAEDVEQLLGGHSTVHVVNVLPRASMASPSLTTYQ